MTPRELADACDALNDMPPVERARAIPPLIDACRTLQGELSAQRKAAMGEATTGPGKISRVELAAELGISKSKVTDALGPIRQAAI